MSKVKYAIKLENLPEQAQKIVELENRLTTVRAQRTEAVVRVTAIYDEQEAELEAELKALRPPTEECIRKNAATLFHGDERSTVMGSVRVGMRYTPHSVSKPGRVKWDEIASQMRHNSEPYVRLIPEVDRQKMLADRTSDEPGVTLALGRTMTKYGLKFSQDEVIYIEGV